MVRGVVERHIDIKAFCAIALASEELLPHRSMHDTYSEIILPFASSPEFFEQYTNALGGIRTGMLMEHLDSLAGSIAYKHMPGPGVETLGHVDERGFYVVTASVDRSAGLTLKIKNALKPVPGWTYSRFSCPSEISA